MRAHCQISDSLPQYFNGIIKYLNNNTTAELIVFESPNALVTTKFCLRGKEGSKFLIIVIKTIGYYFPRFTLSCISVH